MRKKYTAEFKSKVAVDAIKEQKTLAELCSQHGVHRIQIMQWKKILQEKGPKLFMGKQEGDSERDKNQLIEELYKQVGKLTVELDWMKKKCPPFS